MIDNSGSKYYAIIVAGGSGSRMNSAVPKQFLLLNGKPVLMYTVEACHYSSYRPLIIIVIPLEYHSYWQELCIKYDFNIPHTLVSGGDTRFQSVKNALVFIPDSKEVLVAIHDGVRPLVPKAIIDNSYREALKCGNAVTAVKSRESVRLMKDGSSKSLNREDVYLVQTPQTFYACEIRQAYNQDFHPHFTDDASIAENAGLIINIIEGSYINIKITHPEDLELANLIIKKGL